MKLTKKTVYELCAKIWKEYAENPERNLFISLCIKEIEVKEIVGELLKNGCPCCEYVLKKYGTINSISCQKCPMISLWPYSCERDGTPYILWIDADSPEERTKHATTIYKHAEKLLNDND